MSLRPVSVPVLMGEQTERVRRWIASPVWRHLGSVGVVWDTRWPRRGSIDMSAPATKWGSPRPGLRAPRARKARRYPVRAGAVVDVIQDGPSLAGRIAWLSARLMIRPTLSVGSFLPSVPWQ